MFQKLIAIGHLGGNPVIKYTPSGATVANFTVAVDETYKDKSGETVKKTEWLSIVCWEKLAENVSQFLKKGSLVLIEGKLQTRSWDDKTTGEKKYRTEVVASTVKFMDKKPATQEEEPF